MKRLILMLLLTLALSQAKILAEPQDIQDGPATPETQTYLGMKYLWGREVARDVSNAIFWLKQAAEQDYAQAEEQLGLIYSGGFGVPKDTQESQKWWRMAAVQYEKDAQSDNIEAPYQLGELYAEGHGVPQDMTKAMQWYQKAAGNGNESAQWRLKVLDDERQGASEMRKQAEQRKMDAQLWFAMRHGISGHFYTKAECIKWLKIAAQRGNLKAQNELATTYAIGRDVPKDYTAAIYWWQQAAIKGSVDAKQSLAGLYVRGEGVSQDFPQAYKWLNLAAVQNTALIPNRESLARIMTKTQIAEGQRLSNEWLKAHPQHPRKVM